MRRLTILLLLTAALAGCGGGDAPATPVAREEAQGELERVVKLAATSTADELCRSPGVVELICRSRMEIAGL